MATRKNQTDEAVEVTAAEDAAEETVKESPYDKVKIRTPRAEKKAAKSFQIIINGKVWNIPCGQTVEVPRYVAEEFYRSENAKDAYEELLAERKEELKAQAEATKV